jgi:hypothetical protein
MILEKYIGSAVDILPIKKTLEWFWDSISTILDISRTAEYMKKKTEEIRNKARPTSLDFSQTMETIVCATDTISIVTNTLDHVEHTVEIATGITENMTRDLEEIVKQITTEKDRDYEYISTVQKVIKSTEGTRELKDLVCETIDMTNIASKSIDKTMHMIENTYTFMNTHTINETTEEKEEDNIDFEVIEVEAIEGEKLNIEYVEFEMIEAVPMDEEEEIELSSLYI